MGSFLKPPICKCGRKMKLNGGGTGYRPCVCAPRPKVPLRPSEEKPRDLLVEDEREFVEEVRRDVGSDWCREAHLLDIIDRIAPRSEGDQ